MAIVEAAAVQVLGENLLIGISALAKNAWIFRSSLTRLQKTMIALTPILKEIQSLNSVLDKRDELQQLKVLLQKAQVLIDRCNQVSSYNFLLKAWYARKIEQIEKSIRQFCDVDVTLQIARDQKQNSYKLDRLLTGHNISRSPKSELTELRLPPEESESAIGLDGPLRDLKKRLLRGGSSVIVVSAPPGCGKTTLALKLCQDGQVKARFGEIIYIIVSKTPDFISIVKKIFKCRGYSFPDVSDESSTIYHLKRLLQEIGQQPLLLVLDDVWDGEEAKLIIDHLMVELPDYKILITSRYDFPSYGPAYNLEPLNHRDALSLFTRHATEDGIIPFQDHDIVEKIVERCKGFPLLLKVVGGSLKRRSTAEWKSLWMKLSGGESVLDLSNHALKCLQSSLDALKTSDKKLYECFLDLGSFPEDQRIRASSIIDMWFGLHDQDEKGIHGMAYLYRLFDQNLLNLFSIGNGQYEVDGFYNETFVSQHDLVRELAIRQASVGDVERRHRLFMEINRNKYFPSDEVLASKLLSISTDGSFSMPWYDMQVPNVEVLVLNFSTEDYALPKFLDTMNKLKVLILLNHSFSLAKPCNLSIFSSLQNLKRIRLEKISIASLDFTSVQLPSLQKISLVMCNVSEALQKGPDDISGALPNLTEIDLDYCNDLEGLPDWIYEVTKLKRLSITNCHNFKSLSKAIGCLEILENLRLNSCIKLCELPETISTLWELSYLDISGCLGLSKLPDSFGEFQKLKTLGMVKCCIHRLPESIKLLRDLQVFCDQDLALIWSSFKLQGRNVRVDVKVEKPSLNWLRER